MLKSGVKVWRETKSSIVTQYSCCDEEVLKSGVKVWRETKSSIVTQYSCCDEEEVCGFGRVRFVNRVM